MRNEDQMIEFEKLRPALKLGDALTRIDDVLRKLDATDPTESCEISGLMGDSLWGVVVSASAATHMREILRNELLAQKVKALEELDSLGIKYRLAYPARR